MLSAAARHGLRRSKNWEAPVHAEPPHLVQAGKPPLKTSLWHEGTSWSHAGKTRVRLRPCDSAHVEAPLGTSALACACASALVCALRAFASRMRAMCSFTRALRSERGITSAGNCNFFSSSDPLTSSGGGGRSPSNSSGSSRGRSSSKKRIGALKNTSLASAGREGLYTVLRARATTISITTTTR